MNQMLRHFPILLGVLASFCLHVSLSKEASDGKKITVYTASQEETDGLRRLLRSAKLFNYDIKVLGLTAEDAVPLSVGQKVNLLAEELKTRCSMSLSPKEADKNNDELIMFVDANVTVFTAPPSDVAQSFETLRTKIVFGAENYRSTEVRDLGRYPDVGTKAYRYLRPTGFIGYAKAICDMIVPRTPIADDESDLVFYTKIFLDAQLRESLGIKLDAAAEIFQNLDGATSDIIVRYLGSHSYIYNSKTDTVPKVLHGNGPSKATFNLLTDQVPDGFVPTIGCLQCEEDKISLSDRKPEEMPIVAVAVFIERPTPFVPLLLDKIAKLNYPKHRIALFIHNNVPYHEDNVTDFLSTAKDYLEVKRIGPGEGYDEDEARNMVIDFCDQIDCEFAFMLDSLVRINNTDTLKLLIEQNRPVIAPLLRQNNEMHSNFWAAINSKGVRQDSDEYQHIVRGDKKGLWNVPYISNAVLIKADRLKKLSGAWSVPEKGPDASFCHFLRERGYFMYVTNLALYGYLVDPIGYNPDLMHPEMWEIQRNRPDWEDMYIDPDHWKVGYLNDNTTYKELRKYMVCTDAYLYPFVTEKFCDDLVDIMEHSDKWSGGKNEDDRFNDEYYENVPTVDIQMFQVDFEEEWLHLLKTYVGPFVAKAFIGYSPKSEAIMNFVAKYSPGGQDHLRPHFDSSTYSINIALRKMGIDFEGGGTRFVRYNCSVPQQKKGWIVVHPGRFTHWHEGLKVTNGTRYIAISFVDP